MVKFDAHNLHDKLVKHGTSVLRFAQEQDLAFTNNIAESALQMGKFKQKVRGCFRNRLFAEVYCRILSYLYTRKAKGYIPLIALQFVLTGNASKA